MSTTNPATIPGINTVWSNTWLQGINGGTFWDTPGTTTAVIYYYFADSNTTNPFSSHTLYNWDSSEVAALNAAMQLYENVANIDFRLAASLAEADIVWASVNDAFMLATTSPPSTAYGWAYLPGGYFNSSIGDYQSWIAIDWQQYEGGLDYSGLATGGFDFITIIHELGHALGMDHPHDAPTFPGVGSAFGDYGDFDMNQGIFTTMGYNDGWPRQLGSSPSFDYGWQGTPMALDVAWLQAVYGANTTYHFENNTYILGHAPGLSDVLSTIWDTGGIDIVTYSGSYNATIDLRPATLAYASGGGGYVSCVHGAPTSSLDHWNAFTIASGVVIENATGGAGDDTITGNAAVNTLTGNGGADALYGGDNGDVLFGGTGADHLYGEAGDDWLIIDSLDTVIDGGTGTDRVFVVDIGGSNINVASGAIEWVWGYDGTDILNAASSTWAVVLLGWGGTDTLIGGADADWIYGDYSSNGSAGSRDFIYGGGGKDVLVGEGGNDDIYGGDQADIIAGGVGADLVYGENHDDVIFGNGDGDFLYGGNGSDWIYGDNSDNAVSGGNDFLYGGAGDVDVLSGEGGNDRLEGGPGADWLYGGAGVDDFVFTTGWGVDVLPDYQRGVDRLIFQVSGLTNANQLGYSYDNTQGITTFTYGGNTILVFAFATISDVLIQ